MRLIAILLLVTFMQVSASTFAQKVTLRENNRSLILVLKQLKAKTGYNLLYTERHLKLARPVSIQVKNAELLQVLEQLFEGQALTYELDKKTIVIREKPNSPAQSVTTNMEESLMDKQIPVHGRIIDSLDKPLQGASIRLMPGSKSASSNGSGSFTINDVKPGNYTLEISYVGFEVVRKKIKVDAVNSLDIGNVILTPLNSPLDEVQVIAYGTTSRRLSTGSVSKVQAAVIERQPVSNVLQSLQGRVPGLYISQSNGIAGSGINVSIRGRNSINAGNSPLYIVDGVPFSNTTVSSQAEGVVLSDGAAGSNFSPFNTINPDDIESVEVLKDADATSIYGARGANGVILITTKKGKAGRSNFDVNFSQGFGNVVGTADVLGTKEYLDLRKQAFVNDGLDKTDADSPDLLLWDQNAYTDWQKLLIGNNSQITNLVTSFSGGNEDTRFKLSGSFRRETTVYQDDKSYKRGGLYATLDHTSPNKKLNVGFSMIYTKDSNTLPTLDMTNLYNMPPNYPLYTPSGQLYFGGGFTNPLAFLLTTDYNDTENAILNTTVKYNIANGLDLKLSAGYNKISLDMENNRPSTSQDPSTAADINSTFSLATTTAYIVEPQLDYRRLIGRGKFMATIGGTWQQSQFNQPYTLFVTGYSSDALIRNPAAGNISYKLSYFSEYKYLSAFGRLSYNWDDKYLFNATFRRDGSSKFGANNRFGNFGSVGAGWIFSKEHVVAELFDFLSHGKLRGSYGSVGNDQIASNYAYKDTYRNSAYSYGGMSGLVVNGIANPDYQWEVTKKLEFALELGFMKDRVLLTTAVYKNKSDNMLVNYALSPQTGFTSYTANLPAVVENRGLEIELNTRNVNSKTFQWSTDFNISFLRNKLARYDGIKSSAYANTYVVGQPLDLISLYQFSGIVDGVPVVKDLNGDGSISSGFFENGNGDHAIAGQSSPKFFGGLNNSLTFKRFQLDLFFQFVKQKGYMLGYGEYDYFPGSLNNIPTYIASQGIKPTTTTGSEVANGYEYYVDSDAMITDASFIRLKNLSLTYNLPEKIAGKMKMNYCKVFLRGQNLLTFTKYKGIDPETQGNVLPPLRMLTAGLQFNF
ncbi:SusC/RagA family TonB-linked outer membrane protein [Sphingobacterium sp. DR205]|uniref:SusC/RagA family TonB-linked outer membrane protein n=1 Tax=Sphingobacterium sp. DR205 TaxID=2713573 RepID=UPI0013E4B6A8|nr:SusC/RagA family TonB-linked outer membrane protein [Sphingobacterium sp. DR205]QIH35958.1 SusC/RagA family TonB-linked outer membrane protein [Sphingobacterium sp. DR205]